MADHDEEHEYTIMYDCELMRPGCVIIQAMADIPNAIFYKYFGNARCWLTHPTPDMKLYKTTETQLAVIARRTNFNPND